MSSYRTIKSTYESLFKDKGSRFIGLAFPFQGEDSLKQIIEICREKYPKATHYCFAYRLGLDESNFRSNDDGEPRGSAGMPILNQIDSFELTNIIVVVVRYYGGTKLGVSGLINAYKTSAKEVLEKAKVVTEEVMVDYEFTTSFQDVHELIKFLERNRIFINDKSFDEHCTVKISLTEEQDENLNKLLQKLHKIKYNIRKLDI